MARQIDWEKVARAETHPERLQILEAVAAASAPRSARLLAEAHSLTRRRTRYHLLCLKQGGLIKQVGTERIDGGRPEDLYVLDAVYEGRLDPMVTETLSSVQGRLEGMAGVLEGPVEINRANTASALRLCASELGKLTEVEG